MAGLPKAARYGLIVLAVLILGGGLFIWQAGRWFVAPGPSVQPITVVIAKGTRLADIADRLAAAGVVRSSLVTQIGARLNGLHPRAGEYLFPASISGIDALTQMAEGRVVIHKLTVAEGLTVRRVVELLNQADYLAGPITRLPPEGFVFPDTWHLTRDDQRQEILDRMSHAMAQLLDNAWRNRAPNLPLKSKDEALVLASIVERETALAAERPHVAQVFENRLRLGMRLQSDPTTIYGLSNGLGVIDRPLTHEDLVTPHAWNTYTIDALPPTPIAIPGKAALEAVLHPSGGEDLYFVANGGGGHSFARTLADHNKNVAHWRKLANGQAD